MMNTVIMMARMKSQRPGGPSLKGHVRPDCAMGIASFSAAKAGEIIHDKANKGPKRFCHSDRIHLASESVLM